MSKPEENQILNLYKEKEEITSKDVKDLLGVDSTKALNLLKRMAKKKVVKGKKKGRSWFFSLTTKEYGSVLKSSSLPISSPDMKTTSFESRINTLESSFSTLNTKVNFLIEELASFQKRFSSSSSKSNSIPLNQDMILRKIDELVGKSPSKSKWITIGKVFSSMAIEPLDWSKFETILVRMFDRGKIDLTDGTSRRKLRMRGRNYGLVKLK